MKTNPVRRDLREGKPVVRHLAVAGRFVSPRRCWRGWASTG